MKEILDRLNAWYNDKKPFVLYAKPGLNSVKAIFQLTGTAHTLTDFNEEGFVFAPFSDGATAVIPYKEAEMVTVDFEPRHFVSEPSRNNPAGVDAKEAFENLVSLCVAEIKKGGFDKLVASRTEYVDTSKSITGIYEALLYSYPTAFRYCFYHPLTGLWIGATPEQLLKADADIINTVALAGTQLYNPDADAVWETKEQQEQQFVTDYIIKQLHGLAGDITTTNPYTFRAGNIVHIKTDISAQLDNDVSLGNVINRLHPTPAVCGLPKETARDFLICKEGYNREYYSGFLGELNLDNKSDLFVNLRSMKMEQGRAQLFIGCGITKDSDPEKEFFETVNKSMTMRKVL